MSTGFSIHVWPDDFDGKNSIELYGTLINLVPESKNEARTFQRITIYRGQSPIEYGFDSKDPSIVLDKELEEGATAQEVLRLLNDFSGSDLHIRTVCTYDFWKWNNEIGDSEPSVGWFDITHVGRDFERGYKFERSGPYQLYFDRIRHFDSHAIEFEKFHVNPEFLRKIARYGSNNDLVEGICKKIITAINPEHLMIVTEGDRVNPMNFHAVYHSRLSGHMFDVRKILQLHEKGGGYFYEGIHEFSDEPYKLNELNYGSLRNAAKVAELTNQLDSYVSVIGVPEANDIYLTDEEVFDTIMDCDDVDAEEIGGGIYLRHMNFLFGYIEAPYFQLLKRISKKFVGSKIN